MNILDMILGYPSRAREAGEKTRQRIEDPSAELNPLEQILSMIVGPQKKEVARPTPTPTPSPSPTPSPTPTPTAKSGKSYGRMEQTLGASDIVYDAITSAASKYDVPPELMFDIAFSESSLYPGKIGPTEDVGLFQFTPGTWSQDLANYAGMSGSTLKDFDPELGARFDPYKSAMAAAYLIKHGQLGRWSASKWNWGQHWGEEELEPFYTQTPKEKRG